MYTLNVPPYSKYWTEDGLVKLKHVAKTGSQLVNKFPAFYDTRMFINAFTRARHLSLPIPQHSSP